MTNEKEWDAWNPWDCKREREREREYLAKICFVNHAKKSIKEEEIGYVDRYKSYV